MDTGKIFEDLVHLSEMNGMKIVVRSFKSSAKGLLNDATIGLSNKLSTEEMTYTLAHELAHAFLHYDKGDTIHSERHTEYEEQADRGARMLLAALAVSGKEVEKEAICFE